MTPQTTSVPVRSIPIAKPIMGEAEWLAMKEPLEKGWLTQGPKVAAFEKQFGQIHQVTHALATTSCTTGLHLILAALGVGPGDEVIVPAFTWVATANVVLYCGATPIFVDVDPITFNIDPTLIQAKLTSKTKAVMVVHLFGRCADMDAIKAVVGSLPIIEDAACATGAAYKGQFAGALGTAAAFSFHPRKSITTGEGGMVTTQDAELAERMLQLRNHGASISEEERHHGPKPYLLPEFNMMGFNYRMTDLQGAMGLAQLERLPSLLEERRHWAAWYQQALADIDWLITPTEDADYLHGWQSFVCYVDPSKAPAPRNELMAQLQAQGISTRPGTHAVPTLGYYKERFGYTQQDFPNSWACETQSLAIPLHNAMTAEDYQYVAQTLKGL